MFSFSSPASPSLGVRSVNGDVSVLVILRPLSVCQRCPSNSARTLVYDGRPSSFRCPSFLRGRPLQLRPTLLLSPHTPIPTLAQTDLQQQVQEDDEDDDNSSVGEGDEESGQAFLRLASHLETGDIDVETPYGLFAEYDEANAVAEEGDEDEQEEEEEEEDEEDDEDEDDDEEEDEDEDEDHGIFKAEPEVIAKENDAGQTFGLVAEVFEDENEGGSTQKMRDLLPVDLSDSETIEENANEVEITVIETSKKAVETLTVLAATAESLPNESADVKERSAVLESADRLFSESAFSDAPVKTNGRKKSGGAAVGAAMYARLVRTAQAPFREEVSLTERVVSAVAVGLFSISALFAGGRVISVLVGPNGLGVILSNTQDDRFMREAIVRERLSEVPVFAVLNSSSEPVVIASQPAPSLESERSAIPVAPDVVDVPLFLDHNDALAYARNLASMGKSGTHVSTIGLGDAVELALDSRDVLVAWGDKRPMPATPTTKAKPLLRYILRPSQKAVASASELLRGAWESVPGYQDGVPIFVCPRLTVLEESENSRETLMPIFFSKEDALIAWASERSRHPELSLALEPEIVVGDLLSSVPEMLSVGALPKANPKFIPMRQSNSYLSTVPSLNDNNDGSFSDIASGAGLGMKAFVERKTLWGSRTEIREIRPFVS